MTNAPPALATLRMIVTAIIAGNCIVGGAVLFSASRIGGRLFADPMIGYIVMGIAVLAVIIQAVAVTIFIVKPPPRNLEEKSLLRIFATGILVRIAVLECAIVIAYLSYLISTNEMILIAGIVLVLTIISLRPSQSSYRRWRERLT